MLKAGRYVAENNDNYLSRYKIVMDVKETEKSFIFKLVEYDNRYGYDHMQLLFKDSDKAIVRKYKSGHAMRVWDDNSFVIYPFQAGIPFYFRLCE